MPFDPVDGGLLDGHAPVREGGTGRVGQVQGAVDEQGHVAPVGEQFGLVDGHRAGADDADAALAEFIAVAVRAMEDGRAPAFGKARDGGKLVSHAGGQQDAAGMV